MSKVPDYVGIGATKCGTTWWHRNIVEHPDSVVANGPIPYGPPDYVGKQLHHFDEFFHKDFTERDKFAYYERFPSGDLITGEWTPRYMHDWWIPPLLKECAPDVKLLVMLRNPVDRYESDINHYIKWPNPEFFNDKPSRSEDSSYKGFYAKQLLYWLEHFSFDQFLVLQYEKCVADFYGQIKATYDFLGLDTSFVPADRSNAHPGLKEFKLSQDKRRHLETLYSYDMDSVCDIFGLDRSLWR